MPELSLYKSSGKTKDVDSYLPYSYNEKESIPRLESSGYYSQSYSQKYDDLADQDTAHTSVPYKSYSTSLGGYAGSSYSDFGKDHWSSTKALAYSAEEIISKYYPLKGSPAMSDSESGSQKIGANVRVGDDVGSDKSLRSTSRPSSATEVIDESAVPFQSTDESKERRDRSDNVLNHGGNHSRSSSQQSDGFHIVDNHFGMPTTTSMNQQEKVEFSAQKPEFSGQMDEFLNGGEGNEAKPPVADRESENSTPIGRLLNSMHTSEDSSRLSQASQNSSLNSIHTLQTDQSNHSVHNDSQSQHSVHSTHSHHSARNDPDDVSVHSIHSASSRGSERSGGSATRINGATAQQVLKFSSFFYFSFFEKSKCTNT